MKLLLMLAGCIGLTSAVAAQEENFSGGVQVPTVNNKGNWTDPQIGDIILDSSDHHFWGVDDAGNWKNLSDNLSNPMTNAGDMIKGGASGAPERLGAGNEGEVLTIQNGAPQWSALLPAGMIIPFAGPNVPPGFLACDGSEVSQTTYARLFAAIGTTWDNQAKQDGAGGTYPPPSPGNFRVPDLRGVFLRGVGTSSDSSGNNDVSVTLGAFQDGANMSHSHSIDHSHGATIGNTDLSHTHTNGIYYNTGTFSNGATGLIVRGGSDIATNFGTSQPTSGASTNMNHSHSINIGSPTNSNSGSNGGAETRSRNVGIKYIIKY